MEESGLSDESCFILHHMDSMGVYVSHLPGDGTRMPNGRGSVLFWEMFGWETLGSGLHVDFTFSRITNLNIAC